MGPPWLFFFCPLANVTFLVGGGQGKSGGGHHDGLGWVEGGVTIMLFRAGRNEGEGGEGLDPTFQPVWLGVLYG